MDHYFVEMGWDPERMRGKQNQRSEVEFKKHSVVIGVDAATVDEAQELATMLLVGMARRAAFVECDWQESQPPIQSSPG